MERKRLKDLVAWKNNPDRKPLMLRGARQVGKTYLLEEFGRREFPKTHRINFEKRPDLCQIFDINLEPKRIIQNLNLFLNVTIDIHHDLLIFDEIQACPKAITSLKYFCEDLPQLALCTAGSLLGIHLSNTSYPVGKVDLMDLYPMTFEEFLIANDEQKYIDYFNQLEPGMQIPEIFHKSLWNQLLLYFVTGGLPEAVKTFCKHKSQLTEALEKVRKKQKELIINYYADFAKHAGKVNAMHIERIFSSIPLQLAKNVDGSSSRFQFKGVVPELNRYQQLAGAIDWLQAAGLVIKVPIVECAKIPFKAYSKENAFKLLLFDIGILGAMSDLAPQSILTSDYGSYKGYFAENFIAQELTVKNNKTLYTWHEGRAEVEFLDTINGKIIPLEVKSGNVTHAKSLASFSNKYHPPYSIILSAKPFHIDLKRHYHYYPLYLAGRIPIASK